MLDDGCRDYGCGSTTSPPPTPTPTLSPQPNPNDGEPTSTTTPCSVIMLACIPTTTSTPYPTNTPAPYIGPYYTTPTPPSPYLDINIYVDWNTVDFVDVGIDGIGLTADLVSLYAPAAPIAQTVGTLTEGVGFIKSTVELIQGDPQSMLVSQTTDSTKVTVMVFRLERMIPIPLIGSVGNLVSLGINLRPQISIEWVTP